jgi:hypothetical protein
MFNGNWGYSPTSRFSKNSVREFYAKSQGVHHLALLALSFESNIVYFQFIFLKLKNVSFL